MKWHWIPPNDHHIDNIHSVNESIPRYHDCRCIVSVITYSFEHLLNTARAHSKPIRHIQHICYRDSWFVVRSRPLSIFRGSVWIWDLDCKPWCRHACHDSVHRSHIAAQSFHSPIMRMDSCTRPIITSIEYHLDQPSCLPACPARISRQSKSMGPGLSWVQWVQVQGPWAWAHGSMGAMGLGPHGSRDPWPQNLSESLKISQNLSKSFRISQNLSESLEIFDLGSRM